MTEVRTNREIPFEPSTIETVDVAMYRWLEEKLNIYTDTNEGWKKIPVLWINPERAYQVKHNKDLRDTTGGLVLPIITLKREGFIKNPANRGIYWASMPTQRQFPGDVKGGRVVVAKQINQEKTSNFARADNYYRVGQENYPRENKKIVYQTMSIPQPVYVEVSYTVSIKTEYQQQMNDAIQSFITKPGGNNTVMVEQEGHRYEAFIQQDFSQDDNTGDLGEEERMFITDIDIKVLAYLVGENNNQTQPKIAVRENQVEIKIPRERVMVGDYLDLDNKKPF